MTECIMKHVVNFRDWGGYSAGPGLIVRSGMLYRSGRIDHLREPDCTTFSRLGIKTVIDLRAPSEQKRRRPLPPNVRLLDMPLDFDSVTARRLRSVIWRKGAHDRVLEIYKGVYHEMLDACAAAMRQLFEIMGSPESYPLLVHCRAGKDRTGTICALTQRALGVDTGDIIADYLDSNRYVLPIAHRLLRRLSILSLGFFPAANFELLLKAHESCIRIILDDLESRHGGIEKYLAFCGIRPEQIDRVREILLVCRQVH